MKSLVSPRSLAAAGLVLAALGAASAAHARSDIQFSIGLSSPVYVQPAPVYAQPAPVYVQPATVYGQSVYGQPVYVQPAPVYVQRGWHNGHRRHDRADWDRDGVPNRFDRYPTNPYYR